MNNNRWNWIGAILFLLGAIYIRFYMHNVEAAASSVFLYTLQAILLAVTGFFIGHIISSLNPRKTGGKK
jgi:uncharacterized protein YacL